MLSARRSNPVGSTTAFGRHLKQWRRQRGLSQLALGLRAGVSQRHISFIETGRARPRQDVVARVVEALEVPLRERNVLFEAAGLPARYPELALNDAAIEPFRRAIDRILAAQEPFPAFVIDRWWDVVGANRAGRRLFPLDADAPTNFADRFFAPGPLREMVVNYNDVAWAVLRRLRLEAAGARSDDRLASLLGRAERAMQGAPPPGEPAHADLVACPHLRWGDHVVKTMSVVARFGNTREITLDELRIELMLPQDPEAEAFFHWLARQP